MMKFKHFLPDQSLEEMLAILDNNGGMTEIMYSGPSFIQYKLQEKLLMDQEKRHKELLQEQNKYNEKQLFWTRAMAIATICLAAATLIKFN